MTDESRDSAAWPANLAPRPDGTYHILVADRPRRQIVLRVVEQLPAEADVPTELHKLGCNASSFRPRPLTTQAQWAGMSLLSTSGLLATRM